MFFSFITQKKANKRSLRKRSTMRKRKNRRRSLTSASRINSYANFINLESRKRKAQKKVKASKHFYALTLSKIKIKKAIDSK